MCTFGLSGCRVKPRQPHQTGPPGLHTTTRELQTRTFDRLGTSNTTKIPRENPRERRKNEISGGREKKKREILGLPPFGPHLSAPSIRAPNPSGRTFSGLAPTPSGPPPKTKLAKCGLAKFGQQKMAKFGQIRTAKCGQLILAKCGHGRGGRGDHQKEGQEGTKQYSPCFCENVASRRPATFSHKHGLCLFWCLGFLGCLGCLGCLVCLVCLGCLGCFGRSKG